MEHLNISKVVGVSPAPFFSFHFRQVHTLNIKAVAAFEVGGSSLAYGNGMPLDVSEVVTITHEDFDQKAQGDDLVELYAVGGVATTARIWGIFK